jgi:hypothetical protein
MSVSAGYWRRRKKHAYYQALRRHIEALSPAGSILDVGCADTPVVSWGEFERRYTCDLRLKPSLYGVSSYVGDFLEYEPPERPMDVVVCAQVLEHLSDATLYPFAAKLLATGRWVVASVPYQWPEGTEPDHRQDPIDEARFVEMMGREPVKLEVITERLPRMVGLWSGVEVGAP